MVAPRIHVRGATGSGKSTFSAELAARLGVPHIELDALHHGPNWAQPTAEEFHARVAAALAVADRGWVVDGNYDSKLGGLVSNAADTVVWIDPPFHVVFSRLLRRSLHRIIFKVELWNGNRESWATALFGREALLYWSVRSYFRHRREWPNRGYLRLRSDRAARVWLEHTVSARTGSPGSSP